MFDEIYLEADEEVTSAIDKIKKSQKPHLVLVLPRGAMLGQSIVNLKLVYKEASAHDKEVALVTTDKTTRSLAERIGFMVYDNPKNVAFSAKAKEKEVRSKEKEEKVEDKPEEAPEEKKPDDKPLTRERFDAKQEEGSKEKEESKEAEGFVTQPVAAAAAVEAAESVEAAAQISHDADIAAELPEEAEPKEPTRTKGPIILDEDEALEEEKVMTKKPLHEPSPVKPGGANPMVPTRGNLRFFRQQKKRALWMPLLIVLVILVAGAASAAFMVPHAQMAITALANPFQETVQSTVDTTATAIDPNNAIIPGKVLTVTQQTKSSAKATGKKDMGTKATGSVTIYNGWDSQSHTFAAGTTITSKSGLNFVLTEGATVPGAASVISNGAATIVPGKVAATVEASSAGDGYNAAPTTFTIPTIPSSQQNSIYASSTAAFTGGTSNVVTIVTDSDISKLTDAVKAQNQTDAVAAIKSQAADRIVIDKAIQTASQDVTTSVKSGDQADSVEVTVNGTFKVITFTKADQQQLLNKVLANKIPDGQVLVTQGDGVTPDTSSYDLNLVSDTKLELTNNLKAFTITKYDPDLIRHSLVGTSASEAQTIVQRSLADAKVKTTISPARWPRLPFKASNITLTFSYEAKKQ